MVLGLITGATTIEVRVASQGPSKPIFREKKEEQPPPLLYRRPMYSISTDSISMKTNCSDFEDGSSSSLYEIEIKARKSSKKEKGDHC